jgi:sulfur-oxidizing protein SoxY
MNQLRRAFLKQAGTVGAVAVAIGAGLLKPGTVLAATWNKLAFTATNSADAMKEAGYAGGADSKDIMLKVPEIAENGAVVPVEVTSNIPGTTSISIYVDKNPTPLIADFAFSNGAEPFASTRIKMQATSQVRVAVKAAGKVYTQSKEVKVTIGGCGG